MEFSNEQNAFINEVHELVASGKNVLCILRGCPGSGKSTMAKGIFNFDEKYYNFIHEADKFFMRDGRYVFEPRKLPIAHKTCKDGVEMDMKYHLPLICVANTFVTKKDYKEYVKLAEENGYIYKIFVCNGGFQNVHHVPERIVERMKRAMELD